MKTILKYGQAVNARNRGKADSLTVFHTAIDAVRDGYNVRNFERIKTSAGAVIIRKRKGV